ncbi:MAG TPA: hypothetical protein VFS30_11730 [Dehalococcoidia bacterium]|nr:hypothetical protein [Dehalococcoidia bacterium]
MVQSTRSPDLHLDVSPDSQRVERGNEVVFLVTLENRGREAQAQSLTVSGLPSEWCTLEFDTRRRVFPGERRTASLLVQVPASVNAEYHDFAITAKAGAAESTAACKLEVTVPGQVAPQPPAPEPPPPTARPPALSLSPTDVTWRGEAQGEETLRLSVRNVGTEDSVYNVLLEGLPEHWYTLDAQVSVPGARATDVQLKINPPAQARQGNYTLTIAATLQSDSSVRGEVRGTLTIAAPEPVSAPQRTVAPVSIPETREVEHTGPPVMPPRVTLGPRTTFRFGPGEVTAQATITVENQSTSIERYLIMVRGIDEGWYEMDNREVSLQPGASIVVPLRLMPRTGGQFPAGDYSFRVRVAPYQFPDAYAEQVGTLAIAGQVSFDARVTPNRRTGRKEKYKLTLLNTGGLPFSPWLEASDPHGMCKFKYNAPSSLDVGEEAVVPIWVGATRQGFAGRPLTLDFRLRVSPAGGGSSSARTFDASFIHQPFLGQRMFIWFMGLAVIAAIVGVLFVIGFSSVESAVTSIKCGFDDDYQEVPGGPVLVKEECGGAPTVLQKGFFSPSGGGQLTTPTVEPSATTTVTPVPGETEVPAGACVADADLGLAVNDPVKLRNDAVIRDAPAGNDTGRRGLNQDGVITAGPECTNNLVWWEVDVAGQKGWTAEQTEDEIRLILEP